MSPPADTFPRQAARTRNFTCGAPRTFRVARDGSRVVFLRSASGDDPRNRLWVLDPVTGVERMAAGAAPDDDDQVPEAERARRERVREVGGGIVAYDADQMCTRAVVMVGGGLELVDLGGGAGPGTRPLAVAPGAFDPRLAPDGARVAYVSGRGLRLVGAAPGGEDRLLVEEDDPDVSWGSADFVAAEEMGRTRGHWWAPDGRRLAVARVDVGPVLRWYAGDPADPATPPSTLRYPAAGTANARVTLALVDLQGVCTPVEWDHDRFPYLVDVRWDPEALLVTVQTRDQRRVEVMSIDVETGGAETRSAITDEAWVDLVPGTPVLLNGRLVTVARARLALDGEPVSPPGLYVRRVAHADAESGSVVVTGSEDDPTAVHIFRVGAGGALERLTRTGGVHDVLAAGGDVMVTTSRASDRDGALVEVWRGGQRAGTVASFAEPPLVHPHAAFGVVGQRGLRTAVLMPSTGGLSSGPLPVIMDPYGGPHHQRVLRSRAGFLASQWLADQGFAVVVADGRGTPGRDAEWDRAVLGDLAGPVLDDQVEALQALAERDERLDLDRVAIRGWSFGGYLAALAVLRRPDVFHAAVAGAPVTDWALYDTHYTERYLGRPSESPEAYARSSILDDAARLERSLLLIHGLRDDNVVAAHSLRLSQALVAAGRPHRFLPLPGATHMTRDEAVAENLLRLQVAFLREALALDGP